MLNPLPAGPFGCILADPPWRFNSLWGGRPKKVGNNYPSRATEAHYDTLTIEDIAAMPVADVAADDCVLLMWTTWPVLQDSFRVIEAWGFTYKTCGFAWMKANVRQPDLFREDHDAHMGHGYWTRANSEPCLLATRGSARQ